MPFCAANSSAATQTVSAIPALGPPPIIALLGPTASGKTSVVLALAERADVQIISVDSAMVYRGMDIGTAKPNAELLARFPHALVDIKDPDETYSAANFLTDADAQVRRAHDRGAVPVLVGGTMLYAKVFRDGLSPLPEANLEVRADILARADRLGWVAMHAELAKVDPRAAVGIDPQNKQRVQRALEVYTSSGRPISQWWQDTPGQGVTERHRAHFHEFALVPMDRAALHADIEQRFDAMLKTGLVEEVAGLRKRFALRADLPSMRCVGYRQVWNYLTGACSQQEMRERGIAATRQLAKRQLTWLRSWTGLERLSSGDTSSLVNEIAARVHLALC